MPILSNGQILEISSERARYHATRLMLNISRDTPHEDLYALVDVVLADTRNGNIHYPSRYLFSGYTLADTDWWHALNNMDQQNLLAWLGESHVRYEIEGARRRLIYDDLPAAVIALPYPDKLYSNLRQRLGAMPETNLPARQWQQTLTNLQQQGVGQEELHWAGILAWLENEAGRSDSRISKQTILEVIDFFPVRPYLTNELVPTQHDRTELTFRGRYRHLSLYGGEDYREWLVSLPNYYQSYFGPHFTERNVVLHMRTKTRVDRQGRKLLFIEEIQSDWHQHSRRKNPLRSAIKPPAAPFPKVWVSLGLKLMLLHVVEEGFDGIAWADGEVQASRYRTGISAVQRIYNESIPRALLRLSAKWAGNISTSEQVAKVAWFRIEAVRPNKTVTAKHDYVRPLKCYQQAVVSIMEHYCREEILSTPAFILPEGMAEYIKNTGLPLFGEKILFAN